MARISTMYTIIHAESIISILPIALARLVSDIHARYDSDETKSRLQPDVKSPQKVSAATAISLVLITSSPNTHHTSMEQLCLSYLCKLKKQGWKQGQHAVKVSAAHALEKKRDEKIRWWWASKRGTKVKRYPYS